MDWVLKMNSVLICVHIVPSSEGQILRAHWASLNKRDYNLRHSSPLLIFNSGQKQEQLLPFDVTDRQSNITDTPSNDFFLVTSSEVMCRLFLPFFRETFAPLALGT